METKIVSCSCKGCSWTRWNNPMDELDKGEGKREGGRNSQRQWCGFGIVCRPTVYEPQSKCSSSICWRDESLTMQSRCCRVHKMAVLDEHDVQNDTHWAAADTKLWEIFSFFSIFFLVIMYQSIWNKSTHQASEWLLANGKRQWCIM